MQPDKETDNKQPPKGAKNVSWIRILLSVVGVLLLVVIGLLTWIVNDTERVRGIVENVVTDLTGRPFRIKGDFDFTLGPEISITATNIEWTNASWSSQPTMMTIENAAASVNFWSIIDPPIIISNAVGSNARLDFEWNQDNTSNWYLVDPNKPKRKKPLTALPLLLDKADLRNVDIYFRHPKLTEELLITIKHATNQQNAEHNLVLDIDSVFDGRDVQIDGQIGPFPELVIAGAINFDFAAAGPNSNIALKGDIVNLKALKDPNIDFEFAAPEVETVLDILNLPEVTQGEADLKGKFRSGENAANGNVKGFVGEFDINGEFSAASLKPLVGLSLNLNSQGPSAATAGAIIGIEKLPAEPYNLEIKAHEEATGLIIKVANFSTAGAVLKASGLVKDYPKFHDMDLDLDLQVEDMERFQELLPGNQIPDISLAAKAKVRSDTNNSEDTIEASLLLGKMDATFTGTLTEDPNFVGSKLIYKANLPDTQRLKEIFSLPLLRSEKLTVAGEATITESSVILANTHGKLGANSYRVKSGIPISPDGFELSVDAGIAGPDAADAVNLFVNTEYVPSLPYELSGAISFAEKTLVLKPVEGNIGDNIVKADGSIEFRKGIPKLKLNLAAEGNDLSNLMQNIPVQGVPMEGYSVTGLLDVSDQGIGISSLSLKTSDDTIKGMVTSGWPDRPKYISFDITGDGADLRSLLPDIPNYQPAAVSFSIKTKGEIDAQVINFESFSTRLGSAQINLSGELKLPPRLAANDVTIEAEGKHLTDIGQFGEWQFEDDPFHVSASMSGTKNNVSLENLKLQIGVSDLRGKVDVAWGQKPEVNLILDSNLLDLRSQLDHFQEDGTPETAAEPEAQPDTQQAAGDGRVIPNIAIPLELLNAFNGSAKISIEKLTGRRLDLAAVRIDATLRDGELTVPAISGDTNKGHVDASLYLQPVNGTHKLDAQIHAKNLVLAFAELDDYLRGTHPGQNVDGHVTATGSNTRELAASLNGYLWLRGGERLVPNASLGLLFGDFLTEVFEAMNPFVKQEPYQTLACDRMFMEITDGIVTTSPAILLRLEKINMIAAGTVNLKTEEIDFSIETTPRKGIGLSTGDIINAFSKIDGTLAKPKLTLDPTGTLVQGSAAVATMGLSLVAKSLYKRWLGPRKPCEKLTEQAREIRTKRDPNDVPAD